MEEPKPGLNWKRLFITSLLVLLTAGAVGGTTYYVLNSNFQKERDANEKALSDLQAQVKEKPATTTVAETFAPNTFTYKGATTGKKYGAMTLMSIGPALTTMEQTENNFSAGFGGRATVKVTYTYQAPGEPGMFGEFLSFEVNKESLDKLPLLNGDKTRVWFGVGSEAEIARLKPLLGLGNKGSVGNATLVIDNYHIAYAPSEVFNTATVLEVVK